MELLQIEKMVPSHLFSEQPELTRDNPPPMQETHEVALLKQKLSLYAVLPLNEKSLLKQEDWGNGWRMGGRAHLLKDVKHESL